jgi:tripartite-type tricarboxylate transporter receptor subunit TctC
MKFVSACLGVAAALATGDHAFAQSARPAAGDYPVKTIRMVVGYPPGGPTDVIGRTVAQKLSSAYGQQVIVDNRPGASGQTRAVNRVPACGM